MRVVENIHFIECPFKQPGYFTGVTAIAGETITLIDAGVSSSPEEKIFPYLMSIGREPHEISHAIITHAHFDHLGGVPIIKRISKAKVAVHELDKPFLEDATLMTRLMRSRFPKEDFRLFGLFKSLKADIVLTDGDKLDLSEQQLEVLHTPGHSAGSICLAIRALGAYITGDSVQGRGEQRPLIFHSSIKYANSMKRLNDELIRLLLAGHPFPPLQKGVLHGVEARKLIRESLQAIKTLRARVLEEIKASGKPISIGEIHKRLQASSVFTIGCILEDLFKEGNVERVQKGETVLWVVK